METTMIMITNIPIVIYFPIDLYTITQRTHLVIIPADAGFIFSYFFNKSRSVGSVQEKILRRHAGMLHAIRQLADTYKYYIK
ncbi:MAG: hypothetical protein UY00_C0044G0004 [Candidatus Wolfebacteria bacterium GW2011_GWA1_47_6]|nr:MAG: hypothetical protein UY00_C0044G0004 [Candidatus Wolfebacteria bacterium GW2011_GWA1_47_6]